VDDNSHPLVELRRLYHLWSQTFLFDARMRSVEAFRSDRNFAAAEREMQRLVGSMNAMLRDRPDDPEVLDRVAWTLATNAIDPARALELAKRAATLAPGKPGYLHTLAQCHFALGHMDEAIAIEAELVTKEPGNDEYWRQLQKFKEAKAKAGQ
jgi:predicted Zn-dependent protease